MNSTPGICASTMRLTALTPAPPTPTTRMTGSCGLGGPVGASYGLGSSRPYAGGPGSGGSSTKIRDRRSFGSRTARSTPGASVRYARTLSGSDGDSSRSSKPPDWSYGVEVGSDGGGGLVAGG